MSVYIKELEMPTGCRKCELMYFDGETNVCPFAGEVFPSDVERSDYCPLVPGPPHGRLIDADALIVELMDRGIEGIQTDDWHEIQQAVADAPTIIPAEEDTDFFTKGHLHLGYAEEGE